MPHGKNPIGALHLTTSLSVSSNTLLVESKGVMQLGQVASCLMHPN